MDINFEISVDASRLAVRKVIVDIIQQLNEEHDVPIRDIAAELLLISSLLVSDNDFEINDGISISSIFEEDSLDDSSEFYEEDNDENNEYDNFLNSEIYKKFEDISSKVHRFEDLNKHADAMNKRWELLSLLPEYAEAWKLVANDFDEFYLHSDVVDRLMRSCAVTENCHGMILIHETMEKLNSILGDEFIDLEIFDIDFERFNEDIAVFSEIYSHIQQNPRCQQKSIFKVLSIDGRKSTYMLDWAEKLGRIKRVRHHDTWLLSAV